MGTGLDMILTVGSIVIGIMILTGHGDIFMKGGDAQKREKLYDKNKMDKASGIALILIGIATGIDSFTTGVAAKVGYVVVLLIILVVLIYFLKVKCKK